MFAVHPARIKCHVAQTIVAQDFPVEVTELLTVTPAALPTETGGIINTRDIIWSQKAPARGDATGTGPHRFVKHGAKTMWC